ncbi:peroxidasin homolog [Sitodiplosis mosellana]|uniref:peroxidasin homolog n=1 Tax=Sitodiplosis mosellana TaxID=263140 RepID=UPI0024441C4D|nr:peroxidasin homolog [Sitodiplosis mosellana]XP_055315897.1 peroxidasin homolog [Sitodiplosis mosellana]
MNSWKLLLLELLIIGLMTSGMSKPTNEAEEDLNKDYQADDDGDPLEYDDESDQNSNQKLGNSVESNAPAFFKLSDYTETVRAGESVTLKCEIENLIPKNVILWYKGDQKETQKNLFISNNRITPDDRFVYSESDHSLTINNVNETDQDVYLCYVAPNNITMKAKLVVLSNLEAHIYESNRDVTGRSITYRQNETIQVECKVTGARTNNVDFKWSAGGVRITSDDNLKMNGGVLTINKANHDHVRVYQCLADSGNDGISHASVTINIKYIPRVSAHRSVINTKEGDNAELYCDYDSTTESHVVWYKNQQKLQIGTHEPRSKYSVIYRAPKSPNKNTSILVVNNVKSTDLGVYECRVDNEIGAEKVTIELTYVPEPPKLHQVEREGDTVITHWHIRSMQKLQEIMLNYQLKGERDWLQEAVIDQEQSKEHTGIWKIKHKLALAPGDWHVRVKSMNTEGWSGYSNLEDIPVPDKKMNSATTTMVSSCAISFAALLTIYSINWSTRLFG